MIAGTLLAGLCAPAQSLRYPQAARYPGLGAYSYHFMDVFSAAANQAALARLPHASGGIYAERRFMQEKLNSYQVMIGLPAGRSGWGIAAQYFGSGDFNESLAGVAYGLQLGRVDLGVQFDYAMMRAAGYGSDGAVIVEVGTLWHITDQVHAGVHVFNPYGGKFGKQRQEKMAWVYKTGLGYEVSKQVLISAEVIKEEDKDVNVVAGFQYTLDNRFFVRLGIATATTSPWIGAGWAWKQVRADITGSYHPQLGFTPGLLLLFETGKERGQ